MGFLLYDITFLIAFSLFVIIFLYKRRKNLKREGLLYLYRTKVGIKLINFIGEKYKRILKVLSYFVILTGYILMISMVYLLVKLVYLFFKFPEIVKAIKVPPLMPLIPYLPEIFKIEFLPPFYFTYWIIAVAVIAISHEFSHGIFARFNNIKVKSTGFGFLWIISGFFIGLRNRIAKKFKLDGSKAFGVTLILITIILLIIGYLLWFFYSATIAFVVLALLLTPFLAAFVEPDEKGMAKKSIFSQISVLSAGSFANVIMTIIFSLLIFLFFSLTFAQAGATFYKYTYSIVNSSNINSIGGYKIENANSENILKLIENNRINENLTMSLDGVAINLTTIIIDKNTYFIDVESLKIQLETGESLVVYDDAPAIRSGLKGTIVELNNAKIRNSEALSKELSKYSPGDSIEIKTKFKDNILSYQIVLAERPDDKNKPFIGIGNLEVKKSGILGFVYNAINLFKNPGTAYEPKFNSNLIIFIYNLLWWVVIINISVALVNMLPVGIFDGGRVFFLTVLAVTKKEKTAGRLFMLATYVILLILLLLMILWFLSLIQK